jgi:vacuolar protein 8
MKRLLLYLPLISRRLSLLTLRDEQRAETDFFSGEPLRALSTLVYSENVDLQRSASLTFAEITERGGCQYGGMISIMAANVEPNPDVREVDRDTLEPILFLLQSSDIEVQRAASAALGNLAVNGRFKSPCFSLTDVC